MDLKNLYNHIDMCLNVFTRLQEDLLPGYQSIKRHSEFEEYFILDRSYPSYSWIQRPKLSLDTHYLWHWLMTPE